MYHLYFKDIMDILDLTHVTNAVYTYTVYTYSFMYQAPVAWSKLPVLTKSCKTIQTFNYHVKRYFINAYSSSMEAYRVILSYLVTGTITQLCLYYACTAKFMPVQL